MAGTFEVLVPVPDRNKPHKVPLSFDSLQAAQAWMHSPEGKDAIADILQDAAEEVGVTFYWAQPLLSSSLPDIGRRRRIGIVKTAHRRACWPVPCWSDKGCRDCHCGRAHSDRPRR